MRGTRHGWWITVVGVLTVLLALFLTACTSTTPGGSSGSKTIQVVAAENFYGDIVRQLGGNLVSVTSIISDPNIDPHTYESNAQTAIAVYKAKLVIENGSGYDSWMDKILSGSPNSQRLLLTASNIAPMKLPDNPHVWYSIDNVAAIGQAITGDLKKLDPAHASVFDSNLQVFQQSLNPIKQKISEIKSKYAGTPVGLTETIYLYQSGPLGLNVLTPFEFQKAVAEGNDPPASAVITTENQVIHHQVKVLIYNEQTIEPVTTRLQNDAQAQHIPVVPVTETMPPGKTYQSWMLGQLNTLEQALQSGVKGA